MADAIHSVQKLLQDLIAPDVRETKVRLEALEKRMDAEFQSMRKENEAFRNEMRAETSAIRSELRAETSAIRSELRAETAVLRNEITSSFQAVMHAIADLKANTENITLREVSVLRERVAVLEAHRAPQ